MSFDWNQVYGQGEGGNTYYAPSTASPNDDGFSWCSPDVHGTSYTTRDVTQHDEQVEDIPRIYQGYNEQDLFCVRAFDEAQPGNEGSSYSASDNDIVLYADPWTQYSHLNTLNTTGHVDRGGVYIPTEVQYINQGVRDTLMTGSPSYSPHAVSQENMVVIGYTATPRGGRQTGMNLAQGTQQNIRQTACMRCAALKEKCSIEVPGVPCRNCTRTNAHKWGGCTRSFMNLESAFKPEILATRLQPEALGEFMLRHGIDINGESYFLLPLHFGFGRTFDGFQGAEYEPNYQETRFSYFVGPSHQHPESPLYDFSLPVYPTNSNSADVRELVYVWLMQTLRNESDMEDWLRVCFGAEDLQWVRHLLRTTWRYSVQSWDVSNGQHDDLLDTWILTVVTTMLSLPVSIPPGALPGVKSKLWNHYSEHTNSSRLINKCVKRVFFEIYTGLVQKVMSTLDAFKTAKPRDISERHLCHVHSMSILITVIISYLQTSLMDNFRLSVFHPTPGLQEMTFYHLREAENAFRSTTLHVFHQGKEWLKKSRKSGAVLQSPGLLKNIRKINRIFSQEISDSGRDSKLESLLDPSLPFHNSNIKRAFGFYFKVNKSQTRG